MEPWPMPYHPYGHRYNPYGYPPARIDEIPDPEPRRPVRGLPQPEEGGQRDAPAMANMA